MGDLVPLWGSSETWSPQAGDPAHSLGARLKCHFPPHHETFLANFPSE